MKHTEFYFMMQNVVTIVMLSLLGLGGVTFIGLFIVNYISEKIEIAKIKRKEKKRNGK